MIDFLLEPLVGPLTAFECRRSLGRGWVLAVRSFAAVPPALMLLAVVWFWWLQRQIVASYSPGGTLAFGLVAVEGMFVTVALVLGQALLAGTLSGERLRSTAVLLAAQVSSAEIVMARLAGRLSVVATFLTAGLPMLVFFAIMCGLEPAALATLVALPAAVAFGGGGLALAVSTVARTGRDALLMVYLLELLLLFAPFLSGALPAPARQWIEPLNPFQGIRPLADRQEYTHALTTVGLWTLLGAAGCAWAAWRLRPAFLSAVDGPRRRWRLIRFSRLPKLADRPMLWKELYVEQVHAFGRIVKWLGILVVAAFTSTSLILAGIVVWDGSPWARTSLSDLLQWSWPMAWLIQLAVGLRAAAAISSERQRGTWDALLVSPLHAREIVWAKIYGSLYGMRTFATAIVVAWLAGLLCGALDGDVFAFLLAQAIVIGAFMAAVGIAFSLYCESSTLAMTGTVLSWLGAACIFAVLAGLLTLMAILVWLAWQMWHGVFPPGAMGPWPGILFEIVRVGFYGLAALVIGIFIQYRFDALAGRMTSGDGIMTSRERQGTGIAP